MRLKKLTMQAFGPFKDRVVIDFEGKQIDSGLLLISGETGSGKTSIFDAISYVLYGVSSGEERTEKTLRSEYADDDVDSFVELDFEHQGIDYNVSRKLNSSRAKDYTIAGGRIDESGKEKVTATVKDILGLDSKQFHQVVMLAQSEFTKLMDADPKEKTDLFRRIFNTDTYKAITDELKSRVETLWSTLKSLDDLIRERKNSLEEQGFDYLPYEGQDAFSDEGIIAGIKALVEEKKKEQEALATEKEKLQKEYDELNVKVNEQSSINKDLTSLKEKKELREKHIRENKVSDEDRKKCDYYLKVQDIRTLRNDLKNSQEKEKTDAAALEQAKALLERLNKENEAHIEEYELLKTYDENSQKLLDEKKKTEDGLRMFNEYKELKDKIDNDLKQKEDDEKQYLIAKEKYETEKRKYDHALSYKLASELKEGEPCPVCGSIHHPSLADKPEDCLEEKEILKLEKKKNDLEVSVSTYEKLIAEESEKLKKLSDVELKDTESQITACSDAIAKIDAKMKELKSENVRISALKADYDRKLTEAATSEKVKKEDLARLGEQIEELKKNLQEAYAKAGTDQNEYLKLYLRHEEYQKLSAMISRYENDLNTFNVQIKDLEERTAGKSFVDISGLEKQRDEVNGKRKAIDEKNGVLVSEIRSFSEHERKLSEYYRDYNEHKADYDVTNGVYSYVSGNAGSTRISLENYVQSYYLDEVLAVANTKLVALTDGELLLDKKEEATGRKNARENQLGVEFVVRSITTDKTRRPKDISGGEKFKVALSLALGISEVISKNAGGVQMESLFIDEGFGHLDADSLSKAYLILKDISESSSKMIGIISHVEALKTLVDNKIIVTKESYGSRLSVVSA